MSQPWKLTNHSTKAAGSILVSARDQVLVRLAALEGKSSVSVVPELAFSKRGVYGFSEAIIKSTFPFGFVEASRALRLPGEIVVYPAVYPTEHPRAAGYDVMVGGKFHGKRRTTSGTHFAGIRPMQPGDALKQIHWKSSAKGLGVMVKTFEEELSGRISIIMDAGHGGDAKTFDDCLRAVASLTFAALDAGDHVEWIDLAERELMLIPPFADGEEILDRLARMERTDGCLTEENLQKAARRVSHRSAICFVLTEVNEAVERVVRELQGQHRLVSIYIPPHVRADFGDVPVFQFTAREIHVLEGRVPRVPDFGASNELGIRGAHPSEEAI